VVVVDLHTWHFSRLTEFSGGAASFEDLYYYCFVTALIEAYVSV
jgi:hypothetical protein